MQVGWLIDAEMFDGYRQDLVAAVHEQGHVAKLIQTPSPPFAWDDVGCSYRDTFPREDCVVSHGDIELVTRIHRERRWVPGAFCTIQKLAWSHYAGWFGKHLLNRDYVMLPFAEIDRRKEFLFDSIGCDDQLFVRPDSTLKLFAGQVVARETLATDLDFMAFYEFPESSLVVVSSPKSIAFEWRFVVVQQEIVAGCLYKSGATFDPQPQYDANAFEFARSIAQIGYEPDPVWTLDICKTIDGTYHVLEIGAFSCSDLYACNTTDVVRAVSSAAYSEWKCAA